MFELVKKSLLAGIGALAITEEKVRETIDDFVKKGKITEQEGETLVDEVQKIVEENKAKLSAIIDERIKCLMDELHLLTKDDLAEMEKNLRKDFTKLEKRLAKIEKQMKA